LGNKRIGDVLLLLLLLLLCSHHLLPLLLGLKSAEQCQQLLSASAALVDGHLKDAADTLMQAYKHGTHTKVGLLGQQEATHHCIALFVSYLCESSAR
jgi:hypothetical protein